MKVPMKTVSAVIEVLIRTEAVKTVKYLTPTQVVRAVRRKRIGKGIVKQGNIQISLTIGRPNYIEREAIAKCVKAGEVFPINKIRVKFYNPKKIKLKPHGRK